MIDKQKNAIYEVLGTLLTDLSKAFDCKCHDLLVTKFNTYDLSFPAVKMIQDYVTATGFQPTTT